MGPKFIKVLQRKFVNAWEYVEVGRYGLPVAQI